MTTAYLDWSLDVECPKCKEDNDLASGSHDGDHTVSRAIFSNAWADLKGHEVTCEHCGHEFKLDEVGY